MKHILSSKPFYSPSTATNRLDMESLQMRQVQIHSKQRNLVNPSSYKPFATVCRDRAAIPLGFGHSWCSKPWCIQQSPTLINSTRISSSSQDRVEVPSHPFKPNTHFQLNRHKLKSNWMPLKPSFQDDCWSQYMLVDLLRILRSQLST